MAFMRDWRLYALFGLCLAALFALTSFRVGGRLIYTLDDPYIHLAVAENMLRGVYGINLEEYSSPSSSAIYPVLLALGLLAGLGDAAPLVWTVLPMGLAFALFAAHVQRWAMGDAAADPPAWLLVTTAALIPLNALALPLTGMEHPLHILCSALIMAGLINVAETGRAPWWLIGAIMLNPLIRFEGLALSGAASLALMYAGGVARGLIAGAGAAAGVAAFGLFLIGLGLPPLPSSVLMKSALAVRATEGVDTAGQIFAVMGTTDFSYAKGVLIVLCGLCAASLAVADPALRRKRIIVAGAASAALLGHLAGGDYGWFGRYEVYAVCIGLMASAYAYGPALARLRPLLRVTIIATVLATAGLQYARVLYLTPAAAQNIYDQQHQMHRFATAFFPHRAAVNDLGWVSYRNERFVLDLWGLGSNEVRGLRQAGAFDAQAIAQAADAHAIDFAMVYPGWFRQGLPSTWRRMARLTTNAVTASQHDVDFFLIRPEKEAEMRDALQRFKATLPPGAALEILPASQGP